MIESATLWARRAKTASANLFRTTRALWPRKSVAADPDIRSICESAARPFRVVGAVHPADHIFGFTLKIAYFQNTDEAIHHYFANGNESARKLRGIIGEFMPSANVSLFEFASGYGCVTRHLGNELPEADVTACDIHPAAVEFVRDVIGVKSVLSATAPEALELSDTFDVVFALSFFSHMPHATWRRWLVRLIAHTKPGGIVIFTTHGQLDADMMKVSTLDDGFWFDPQSEQVDIDVTDYGITITLFDYVYRQIKSAPDVRLIKFQEGFWWGHQDVYVLRKVA